MVHYKGQKASPKTHSGPHGCEKLSQGCLPLSSEFDGIPNKDLMMKLI